MTNDEISLKEAAQHITINRHTYRAPSLGIDHECDGTDCDLDAKIEAALRARRQHCVSCGSDGHGRCTRS